MRYFSTTSTTMFVVRKEGYYMSERVAIEAARRVALVLQLDASRERRVAQALHMGFAPYGQESAVEASSERLVGSRQLVDLGFLSPSEFDAVSRLIAWYSADSSTCVSNESCYTLVDLNRGVSISFVSMRTDRGILCNT